MTGFSLSSSPFSPFHLNRNAKLRLSQFVNQQSVAYLAYDKDKSYRYIHRAPKLRGWLRTPQTMLGSEDKSQIRGPQTAVLEPRNHDFNPKGFFPFGISSFHLSANDGKPGLVTFCNRPSNTDNEVTSSNLERIRKRISWFLGPAVLVLAFVYPPLFLPQVILRVFGDSPLTVFLLIFFTEVIFYCGVAVFLLLLNRLMRLKQLGTSANNIDILTLSMDKQITSVTTLVLRQLSIAIPMISMGLAWPWTGFVVPATLSPYLVGIFVQFIFELFARCWKSPSWAAIPFIFQLYRMQQIHRAANLITFLSYQVRGVEIVCNKLPSTSSLKMPSTSTLLSLPSNSTLQSLSVVLFLLLVICIWSFSSFLMAFLLSIPQLCSDAKMM